MNYTSLLLDNQNGIVTITINRPKALNAINQSVMSELGEFFGKDFVQIDNLKGVIITGSGEKAFVAGADIKQFASLNSEEGSALSLYGQNVYFSIERFHVPVIAAVNGFALGGGCELAMACHMRVASDNAKFGQPEVNLGLIPGYGGTQRLAHLIGKGKAIELLLTGDMISADEAHNLGLVNHVTSAEELRAKAAKIITKISRKGPLAIKHTIKCVNAAYDPLQNGYEMEYKTFGELIASEDSKEGALAFVEKRPANFKGK